MRTIWLPLSVGLVCLPAAVSAQADPTCEVDVHIMLQSSAGIGAAAFDDAKRFATEQATQVLPDAPAVRIAIAPTGPSNFIAHGFQDNQERSLFEDSIRPLGFAAVPARLDDGVVLARNNFRDRSGDRTRILIIVTDGRPAGGHDPCPLRADLDAQNVRTLLVMNGPQRDPADLLCLVDDPDSQVINIEDFTPADHLSPLSDPVCTVVCGDGVCEGDEDGFNCAEDCPPPQTSCDVDVHFMLQTSASIGETSFDDAKRFAVEQATQVLPEAPAVRIAVAPTGPTNFIAHGFGDNQDRSLFEQSLNPLEFAAVPARLDDGVVLARNNFRDRSGERTRILIIVTDGQPAGGHDPCPLRADLDAQNVRTLLVMNGPQRDPADLLCLVDDPDSQVINIEDFSAADHLSPLNTAACTAVCGDGVCEGDEDATNCNPDCAAPPQQVPVTNTVGWTALSLLLLLGGALAIWRRERSTRA